MHAALLALVVASSTPTWTLVAGGDIMLNGVRPATRPFQAIAPVVRSADVAYANLEIPLTDVTTRTTRKSAADIAARNQFVLKADPEHIGSIAGAGFDLVSLANNHAMDFGPAGLRQMTGLLDAKGIRHAGAGSDRAAAEAVAVVNRKGIRIGMVSYLAFVSDSALWTCGPATADAPGIATLPFGGQVGERQRAELTRLVRAAKQKCDFLIVALHWGIEKQTVPRDYQVRLGRAFVDAGANLVLGAHPHVLQGAETWQQRGVFYSLGNLVSPLPAETALFRLTYQGLRLTRVEVMPARISGGRVTLREGGEQASGLRRWDSLNAALRRAYPGAGSRPLP